MRIIEELMEIWLNEVCDRPDRQYYLLCHDLAKQLSYYLYFFSFLFLFFYLGLTTQEKVWESVMSQVSYGHSHITRSHSVTSHDVTMIGHLTGMGKKCTDHIVVV